MLSQHSVIVPLVVPTTATSQLLTRPRPTDLDEILARAFDVLAVVHEVQDVEAIVTVALASGNKKQQLFYADETNALVVITQSKKDRDGDERLVRVNGLTRRPAKPSLLPRSKKVVSMPTQKRQSMVRAKH